ncbi:MAG: tRNA (guanosine(37)-N1)-methyltransferase TrmD [Myxococcota bacterium]
MSGPRIDILTLFPDLVRPFLEGALLGAACRSGTLAIRVTDLRDFAEGPHRQVDDAPYGGGDGMGLQCGPVVAASEAVSQPGAERLLLTPAGERLDQSRVLALSQCPQLVLVCGRYAGFDERIAPLTGARELSIGDYVLSGGEAAALVVTEAVARQVPGVLGNPVSVARDSFADGLLEHPLYTRPVEFRGLAVPEVLLSGDHARIARWRRAQALARTRRRRPALLDRAELSGEDRELLREIGDE